VAAQEILHTWSINHGLNLAGADYGDPTDAMSADRNYRFSTTNFGWAGSLLSSANLRRLDPNGLPSEKVLTFPAAPGVTRQVVLSAWTRPENRQPVLIRLTNEPLDRTPNGFGWTEVLISLRMAELFDQGFAGHEGVVIHGWDPTNSRQILLSSALTSGTVNQFNNGAWSVRVDSVDLPRGLATLTITN
jgi:hypothetical protein